MGGGRNRNRNKSNSKAKPRKLSGRERAQQNFKDRKAKDPSYGTGSAARANKARGYSEAKKRYEASKFGTKSLGINTSDFGKDAFSKQPSFTKPTNYSFNLSDTFKRGNSIQNLTRTVPAGSFNISPAGRKQAEANKAAAQAKADAKAKAAAKAKSAAEARRASAEKARRIAAERAEEKRAKMFDTGRLTASNISASFNNPAIQNFGKNFGNWYNTGKNARIANEATAQYGNIGDLFARDTSKVDARTLFGDDRLQRGMSNRAFKEGKQSNAFGRPDRAFGFDLPESIKQRKIVKVSAAEGGPMSGPTPVQRRLVSDAFGLAKFIANPKVGILAALAKPTPLASGTLDGKPTGFKDRAELEAGGLNVGGSTNSGEGNTESSSVGRAIQKPTGNPNVMSPDGTFNRPGPTPENTPEADYTSYQPGSFYNQSDTNMNPTNFLRSTRNVVTTPARMLGINNQFTNMLIPKSNEAIQDARDNRGPRPTLTRRRGGGSGKSLADMLAPVVPEPEPVPTPTPPTPASYNAVPTQTGTSANNLQQIQQQAYLQNLAQLGITNLQQMPQFRTQQRAPRRFRSFRRGYF